jgi:microcystin-dependent protein
MDELLGTIKLFAGNFPPRGYAFCDGSLLLISEHEALFEILGTTYGGQDTTKFALPDLRGRIPIGIGDGPNLSYYTLGQQKGVENNKLAANNIPALGGSVNLNSLSGTAAGTVSTLATTNISIPCSTVGGNNSPVGSVFGADSSVSNYATTAESGKFMKPLTANLPITFTASLPVIINNGTGIVSVNPGANQVPVTNIQPVLGLNYIICIEGTYPSRKSNRRRILIDGKETQEFNVKNYNYFHQIGSSPEKKKIIRVNNPFDKSKYSFNPIIQVINDENYKDVFATSLAGPLNGDYFEVVIYRIDGDSWAQNLFMRISFNYYENEF